MSEAEPNVKCENCEREIPESKLFLHESYCRRNVIRCPKCNAPVDKAEMEAHEAEAHKMAPCKYCKKEFEPAVLLKHLELCNKKPRLCEFCNCDVVADEYTNHKYTCGSRTKKCPYCSKNIMIRDYESHEPVCEINSKNFEQNFPKIEEKKEKNDPNPKADPKQIKPNPTYGLADKSPTLIKPTDIKQTNSVLPDKYTSKQPSLPTYSKYPDKPIPTSSTSTSSTKPTDQKAPTDYKPTSDYKPTTDYNKYLPNKPTADPKSNPSTNPSSNSNKTSSYQNYINSKTSASQPSNTTNISQPKLNKQSSKDKPVEIDKKTQEEIDAEIARKLMEEVPDDFEIAKQLDQEYNKNRAQTKPTTNPISQPPQRVPSYEEYYDDDHEEYSPAENPGNVSDPDAELQKAIQESMKQNNYPKPTTFKKNDSDIPEDVLMASMADDPEIQRAIEESLKGSKMSYGMGDTLNSDDFKKAIELSKKQK